jgi:hypothetical protein
MFALLELRPWEIRLLKRAAADYRVSIVNFLHLAAKEFICNYDIHRRVVRRAERDALKKKGARP